MKQLKYYRSIMAKDIYEDPMYWLGAAFFSGFLFASWSWGILYLLSFLIVYEIFYCIYCRYKNNKEWGLQIRIGIVAGTLMGFLIGRNITEDDDHKKSIDEFCSSVGKIFGK